MRKFLSLGLVFLGIFGPASVASGQSRTVQFTVDETAFPNPERGWFYSVNANSDNSMIPLPSASELKAMRDGPEKITLIRRYYILSSFRDSPISAEILNQFGSDCEFLRANGMKLIPRFVYSWSSSRPREDVDEGTVALHLEQLRPFFNAHKAVIAHVEAGLVGYYGEWHDSTSGHIDNRSNRVLASGNSILDKLLDVVPVDRQVAVRYLYWNKMQVLRDFDSTEGPVSYPESFSATKRARLGHHQDRLAFEPDYMLHRFDETQLQMKYIAEDSKWVVVSGEPETGPNYTLQTDPRPGFAAIRLRSMAVNANSSEHYEHWHDQGYFDEITKRLGYRFRLDRLETVATVQRGATLPLLLQLTNEGWGAPYNPRDTLIVLKNESSGEETTFNLTATKNCRFWGPGSRTEDLSVRIPTNLSPGSYSVYLALSDPDLPDDHRFSIRCANRNAWDEISGRNRLLSGLNVTSQ